MSFDVMVFDPDIAPYDKDGFRDWYESETGEKAARSSSTPEVADKDAFRDFYEQMREVFSPFNGPDDVPLPTDVSQIRILRTCEYFFRPHSVYMCFRWPAQDFARAACSTFAKALNLGLFQTSSKYPQARFPGDKYLYPYGDWKDGASPEKFSE
jgi:hypothetical protein